MAALAAARDPKFSPAAPFSPRRLLDHRGSRGAGRRGASSPDTRSWGFAFRPSTRGTPFGHAEYQRVWLFGDWYTFDVNNDD